MKYRDVTGLINYAAFCHNIDVVFLDTTDQRSVIHGARSTANFSLTEQQALQELINAIRTQIKNNRILIKPQFQDYDRTKSCHVTAEQFRRVLKECQILPPSEDLYQVLIRRYFDKGNIREVNYVNFCMDIDKSEDLFQKYVAKKPVSDISFAAGQLRDSGNTFFADPTINLDVISNRFLQKRVEISNDPNDIEVRLQATVVMKRVRIEEFFFDFDKLRKGKVHKGQF